MADLITWEDKVNNPELVAFLEQYGEEEYLRAEEINQVRDAINHLNRNKVTKSIRFIPHGEMLVFEQAGKATSGTLAPGDYCMLRIGDEIISAPYLGGDIGNPSSYDI